MVAAVEIEKMKLLGYMFFSRDVRSEYNGDVLYCNGRLFSVLEAGNTCTRSAKEFKEALEPFINGLSPYYHANHQNS